MIVTPATLVVVHSTCLSVDGDITVFQLIESHTSVATPCTLLLMYAAVAGDVERLVVRRVCLL